MPVLPLLIALLWLVPIQTDCQLSTPAWEQMEKSHILVRDGQGKTLRLEVRIADQTSEMAAGYKWICPETARDSAMLFIFNQPYRSSFYMKDVFVPLDLYFFDAQGQLINHHRMRPVPPGSGLKVKYYKAEKPASYALETPQGVLQAAGLQPNGLLFERTEKSP